MGPRINERIRVPEILIITDTGEKLGPMSPREGVEMARARGLDLIEVAPTARPPVCRIAEYGKYKYDLRKKEREAARKQRQSSLKEMTLTPRIDDHDLEMKTKNIVKFLADGDKVKVTVRFKSREMSHPEFAYAALNKIIAAMTEAAVGVVERPPIMEGRQMILILSPQSAGGAKKPSAPKPAKPASPKPAPASAAPRRPARRRNRPDARAANSANARVGEWRFRPRTDSGANARPGKRRGRSAARRPARPGGGSRDNRLKKRQPWGRGLVPRPHDYGRTRFD